MIGSGAVQKITIPEVEIYNFVVLSCDVSCRAEMISHPIESGGKIFDNKVIEPRTITIQALVSARDSGTIGKLAKMWSNRTYKFYTITTRAGSFPNFCCEECSHKEDNEKLDALLYTIKFKEILKARGRTSPSDVDDYSPQGYGSTGS